MTALPTTPPEPAGLMTTAEVAKFLGVNTRHIYRLVQEGRIPHYRWGRLPKFHPAEITAWLKEFRRPAGGEQ